MLSPAPAPRLIQTLGAQQDAQCRASALLWGFGKAFLGGPLYFTSTPVQASTPVQGSAPVQGSTRVHPCSGFYPCSGLHPLFRVHPCSAFKWEVPSSLIQVGWGVLEGFLGQSHGPILGLLKVIISRGHCSGPNYKKTPVRGSKPRHFCTAFSSNVMEDLGCGF